MHCCIIYVLKVYTVLTSRRPYVSFFEQKDILILIKKDPNPNIKFPFANKQRPFNVLLDYKVIMLNLERTTFWRMLFLVAFLDGYSKLLQLVLMVHNLFRAEVGGVYFIHLIHLVD